MIGRRMRIFGWTWVGSAMLAALLTWAPLGKAQTLDVPVVAQQEVFWCWAASSQAVLDYYNAQTIASQCQIADWARTAGDWGADDCCVNSGGNVCNQINNICTGNTSIRSILRNWEVESDCVFDWAEKVPPLPPDQIEDEIEAGRPFVMRILDFTGHFVVGDGFQRGNDGQVLVRYMDPWGQGDHVWALYEDLEQLVQPDPADPKTLPYWNIALQLSTNPWTVDKAVLTGDTVPDGATISEVSGHVYGLAKGFDVNDAGTVIYIAKLEQDGQPDGEGIYTTTGEVVARSGEAAPGGGRFARFYMPNGFRSVSINNAGQAVFLADLEDGAQGIYTANAAIAKTGQAAPEGGTFKFFHGTDINQAGQMAFIAHVTTDSGTQKGIYLSDGADITLVTRAGVFSGIPTLRNDGLIVYLGGYPNQAIADSTGQIYAQSGGDAPGGGTYAPGPGTFNYPDVAMDGVVEPVFSAELESRKEGVFTQQRRIAVTGEVAPGGGTFVDLAGRPAINSAGRIVYLGDTSDGRRALFDDQGNEVAARGQMVFVGHEINDLADPVLTDTNRVAFYARVSKEGVRREGIIIARP